MHLSLRLVHNYLVNLYAVKLSHDIGVEVVQCHYIIIPALLSQMVLLYRDPTGESIKETISSTHQGRNSISILKTDTLVGLEGKIALLEGKLKEKDETIGKMKLEIEATRKVREEIKISTIILNECTIIIHVCIPIQITSTVLE